MYQPTWALKKTVFAARWFTSCLCLSIQGESELEIRSTLRGGEIVIELHRGLLTPPFVEDKVVAVKIDGARPVRWSPSAALEALVGKRLEGMHYNGASLYLYTSELVAVSCMPYEIRDTGRTALLCNVVEENNDCE